MIRLILKLESTRGALAQRKSMVFGRVELHLPTYRALEEDYLFWKQKARYYWLIDDDKNTRFFHAQAKGRFKKNFISSIKVGQAITRDSEHIHSLCIDYFAAFYGLDSSSGLMMDGCSEGPVAS
ncbi:hypothetical protein EJ110_NYTH54937 [Nymphaea thermarum]|nr:hypothetical protein EJ110_NYTH54937 [Nymphaea thermarum]